MNDTIFVKPKDGQHVRHEASHKRVDTSGEHVPNSSYYRRRINDGDLVIVTTAPAQKAAAKKSTK